MISDNVEKQNAKKEPISLLRLSWLHTPIENTDFQMFLLDQHWMESATLAIWRFTKMDFVISHH